MQYLVTTGLFLSLCQLATAAQDAPASPPNFVVILADDLGVHDLGCYGRQDQPTPHLDAFARQGLQFASAYCAQPICSPTRAALMTGKSPARLHLTTFLPGRPDTAAQLLQHPPMPMQLPLEETTIAESLRAAGYATGCFGKWHLGGRGASPSEQGFDVYFPGQANTHPSAVEGGKGEYRLTTEALRFIENNRQRPFFVFLSHNSPHVPLAARPAVVEKHRDAFNPTYAAMIETLDDTVGQFVRRIDELGLAERTLIIFTSDNGGLHVPELPLTPATHNTPFRAGKGYVYEGGLRVPLLVRWTGTIPADTRDATPVITTDWVPTLLELAGLPSREPCDGLSLAGLLAERRPLPPRPLFWHFPHYTNQGGRPAGAVRHGDWKLIEHYEDGRCELYQLEQDAAESHDLAAAEPARVAELRGQLESWRRTVDAQPNSANPLFDLSRWRDIYGTVETSQLATQPTAVAMVPALETWRRRMDAAVADRAAPHGPGAILLAARDARVHGDKLRYEPEPHKDTLGYWTETADWAEWQFEAAAAGQYDVQLLVGCGAGSGGAIVEVQIAGQSLTMTVEETGHFQRFVPHFIGHVTLPAPGAYTLAVRARTRPGPAVMDLRRVSLWGRGG